MIRKIGLLFLVPFLLAVTGFLPGCASRLSYRTLTPDQRDYAQEFLSFPLIFRLPKAEAEDAWGRAQSFIGLYSHLKILTATDYIIETEKPPEKQIEYAYKVIKTPMGDSVEFDVDCNTGNMFAREDAKVNAHILAHYMSTGKLLYRDMINQ